MKLDIRIAPVQQASASGATLQPIEFTRESNHIRIALEGRTIEADAIEVAAGTYSVLIAGRAYEVRVAPSQSGLRVYAGPREFNIHIADPRAWGGRRGGAQEAEGRQEVLAPMPGKIARVLVKQGDKVEAGQGLCVVEAMKMQNEIRSPKTGTVERLLVEEGQAVNSGESLAIVA
jgi:biotin carboxyl carrier protein